MPPWWTKMPCWMTFLAQVQASGADVIDMRDDYRANKDQYLYFKTDHHWTPDGAYRAYQQFCTLKNSDAVSTANVYTKKLPSPRIF